MNKKDYYEVLGLSKGASKEDIKKAYKKLAKQYHPDISKDKGTEEKFKEISEAYAVLSDDNKRKQYDQFGHAGFDQRYSQEDIFRNAHFEDIFSEIFGRNSGDQEDFFGGSIFDMFFGGSQRKQRGADLRYDLEITLEEAARGVKKTLHYERLEKCKECKGTGAEEGKTETCKHCNGTGQYKQVQRTPFGLFAHTSRCGECNGSGKIIIKKCKKCHGHGKINSQKEIQVSIPAGVDNGMQLRLNGEGETGSHGTGDLYVFIHVLESEIYERRGMDLYTNTKVSFADATLGTIIEVPTLEGNAELKVPAGTQPGTLFRLKSKGMRRVNSSVRGDLYIKVNVEVPQSLSKRQKELIEELKENESKKKSIFEKISE